jgi:hypothetical protein
MTALGRGSFGVVTTRPGMRYAGKPGMQRAYEGIVTRMAGIEAGPWPTGIPGISTIGPFKLVPQNVAQEFAAGIVDGVVGAMQSEDAQAAIKKAVKPYVFTALALGAAGLLAGVGGAVIAMTRRR